MAAHTTLVLVPSLPISESDSPKNLQASWAVGVSGVCASVALWPALKIFREKSAGSIVPKSTSIQQNVATKQFVREHFQPRAALELAVAGNIDIDIRMRLRVQISIH